MTTLARRRLIRRALTTVATTAMVAATLASPADARSLGVVTQSRPTAGHPSGVTTVVGSRRAHATLTDSTAATPDGDALDTMATCAGGAPGIEVGVNCDAVPAPGFPAGGNYVQLLALNPTTLSLDANDDVDTTGSGPTDDPLTGAYSNLPPGDIVVLSSPHRAYISAGDAVLLRGLGLEVDAETQFNPPPGFVSPFSVVAIKDYAPPAPADNEAAAYSNYDQILGGTPGQNGDVAGAMQGFLQQDPSSLDYSFVFPDYVPFSTHLQTDAADANTITVGTTTYPSAALPAGESGFQAVVLDPDNLSLLDQGVFPTNGTADDAAAQHTAFTSIEDDVEQSGATSPVANGRTLLLLQSIGHPSPAGPDWADFANFAQGLGGTAAIFNSLDAPASAGVEAVTSYAIVADYTPIDQFVANPNRSIGDEASLAVGGPIVALKGQLARIRTAQMAPYIADNANVLDQSLFQAAYQPTTTWPYSTGPDAQTVIDIDTALQAHDGNFPPQPLRTAYWQALGSSGWSSGAFLADLQGLCSDYSPTAPACSDPDFSAVKAQLVKEFTYVDDVSGLLDDPSSGLQEVVDASILSGTDNVNAIASDIIAALPGGSASNGTVAIVDTALNVTSQVLAGLATPLSVGAGAAAVGLGLVAAADAASGVGLPVAAVIGAVAAVCAIVAIFVHPHGATPSPFIGPLESQAADLGPSLVAEYSDVVASMGQLGQMLTFDYGRLMSAGPQLQQAADALDNPTNLTGAETAFQLSERQSLWSVLAPVAYTQHHTTSVTCAPTDLKAMQNAFDFVKPLPGNLYYYTDGYTSAPAQPETAGEYLATENVAAPSSVTDALYGNASVSTHDGTLDDAGLDPLVFLAHYSNMNSTAIPDYLSCGASATGDPLVLSPYGGNSQATSVGTSFPLPLVTRVSDAFGVPQVNSPVTFEPPSSTPGVAGLTFTGDTTVATADDALATSPTATADATDGSYTLDATSSNTGPAEFVETNVGAADLVVSGGGGQTTAIDTAFADLLAVTVTMGGQPVADQEVTFTAPTGEPSATFPDGSTTAVAVTDAAGEAVAPPLTADSSVGSYQVTAAATGDPPAIFALTNTQMAASGGVDLAITGTGPPSVGAGQAVTIDFTVTDTSAAASTGFSLAAPIPSGLSEASTTTAGCSVGTPGLTCTEGALAAGADFAVELDATAPSTPGPVSITATVTGVDPDPDTTNDAATVTVPVVTVAGTPLADPAIGAIAIGLLGLAVVGRRRRRRGQGVRR